MTYSIGGERQRPVGGGARLGRWRRFVHTGVGECRRRRNSSVGKPQTLNPSKNRVSEKARFWYVSNEPESKVANSAVNVRTGFFMNESINTIMVFHNLIIVSPNDES